MPTPIKIGVIGAGSATFSAGLMRDVCLNPNLLGSTITFMDIDRERVEMAHLLASRYAEELAVDVRFEKTTDRAAALSDADFVINTAAYRWDHGDTQRQVAEKHGFYRGAGGGQYHNLKIMMDVARDMERICPDAWLIQSGNPVFEGVTLMTRETGVKVIGLCHGHFGYKRLAIGLGLDPAKMTCFAPGINHLIFGLKLEYDGKDAYPLIEEWLAEKSAAYWANYVPPSHGDDQMSPAAFDLYKFLGYMPIGDTARIERNQVAGWVYHTDLETKKRWFGPYGGFGSEIAWEMHLKWMQERVDRIFAVAADRSISVTKEFPAEPTHEQQIPIIDSLVNNVPAPKRICPQGWYQVNIPNQGTISGVADDVTVEMPALIDKWGVHPVKVGKLPDRIMLHAIAPAVLQAERAVEAYRQRDWRLLVSGLLHDHRAASLEQVDAVTREIFELPFNAGMAEHYRWGK